MRRRVQTEEVASKKLSRRERNAHLYNNENQVIRTSDLTLTPSKKPKRKRLHQKIKREPLKDVSLKDINEFLEEEKEKRLLENTQEFKRLKDDSLSVLNILNKEYIESKEETGEDKSFEEELEELLVDEDPSKNNSIREQISKKIEVTGEKEKLAGTGPTVYIEDGKLVNSFFTTGMDLSQSDFYNGIQKRNKGINILIALIIIVLIVLIGAALFFFKGDLW